MAGGPASLAGGVYHETSPSAKVQNARLIPFPSDVDATTPAAPTITFAQPPDVTVGTPVTLSAHASSGLPVSFSSGTSSVCTVTGSVVTTVAAGPCTITASQGGSARYAAALPVTQSFQVDSVPSKVAGVWVILLAAVILAAATATMVLRRRRLRSHPPPAPAPAPADQIVPFHDAPKKSARLIKGAKEIYYPGAPHGLQDTHADQINADLLAFLRS